VLRLICVSTQSFVGLTVKRAYRKLTVELHDNAVDDSTSCRIVRKRHGVKREVQPCLFIASSRV
jgi:hypothetical protein